jgi:hypothetical protein
MLIVALWILLQFNREPEEYGLFSHRNQPNVTKTASAFYAAMARVAAGRAEYRINRGRASDVRYDNDRFHVLLVLFLSSVLMVEYPTSSATSFAA